uniref:3-keto-5-aminohexanoate cleavage enzyme n=1 Tax=Grammatophora oceanica TaxID=210454 RepID=A0A6U5NTN7_9STRA|mmetsp:Transcript_4728/g.6571  ORF Transcript_4728/g.6571 Transcript_4728/m.6571 type:complete len:312 (+) Transcript_4728:132-1067(+)|eukprot:CAMPEP_0194046562 /NCGR_PEP_ID=MMETSP0009_2-20130614/21627_1 /TAXON_ID=210454 /ORGANISM="Grammatophora oceanica, Strain CCMP 410" /LENGTH=311 /DNA_ID=CAMNT_0038691907 /DNA_START=121 /DNA_END=1056 /DNA_ORIENTATION=-
MVGQLTKEHGKLVLTVALTGNINTKERNPNLPCSPQEIADDIHECAKLGAVFFHIHARDENNKPTMRVEIFREICRLVKLRDPNVIIQISTGGRAPPAGVDVDPNLWRINPLDLLPESGSFTPGSVNLEPIIYKNSPELVQLLAEKYRDTGIKPEIECFDSNMITKADQLVKKGLLTRPIHFGFVMGAPGAQGATVHHLSHLVSLLTPGDTWSTIGIGKYSLPLATAAIALGGHVRVGLEDNNRMPDGSLATNASMVKHIADLAKMMGRELATPDEAREILSLPMKWKDRIVPQLNEPKLSHLVAKEESEE